MFKLNWRTKKSLLNFLQSIRQNIGKLHYGRLHTLADVDLTFIQRMPTWALLLLLVCVKTDNRAQKRNYEVICLYY